jgi:hypothetical protein
VGKFNLLSQFCFNLVKRFRGEDLNEKIYDVRMDGQMDNEHQMMAKAQMAFGQAS